MAWASMAKSIDCSSIADHYDPLVCQKSKFPGRLTSCKLLSAKRLLTWRRSARVSQCTLRTVPIVAEAGGYDHRKCDAPKVHGVHCRKLERYPSLWAGGPGGFTYGQGVRLVHSQEGTPWKRLDVTFLEPLP
jgi:hypothetical protein